MDLLTLQILQLFENNPSQILTIHGISKLLKRTYPFVYKKVNNLIEQKILNQKTIGRTHQITPNLENERTILYFAINSQTLKNNYLQKSPIKEILRDFTQKTKSNHAIKTILLFGSYAKGKETKKSDIDMLFLVAKKDRETDEYILSIANTVNMERGCSLNPIIVDDSMFKEMLKKAKTITVGTEALQAHVLFYGFEHFWTMVGGSL